MKTYTSRAMYTFTCLLLAGCAKEPPAPVYLTAEIPDLPRHCFPDQVPPDKEPKLNPSQDATDVDAVRDRGQWKAAYRTEKALRATCAKELNELFPSKERGKPTS